MNNKSTIRERRLKSYAKAEASLSGKDPSS